MTDILGGTIGEGIENILAMRGGEHARIQYLCIQLMQDLVPVVVAITKFDVVVDQVLFEFEGGNSQYLERARARAYTQCEQICRSLFCRELRDVPAVILSGNCSFSMMCSLDIFHLCVVKSQFHDLVDDLIVTTDRLIMDSRPPSTSSARSSVRGTKGRIAPVPLMWSAALRVSRDVIIQTSIEYVLLFHLLSRSYISFPELVEIVSMFTWRTQASFYRFIFLLGYWRSLWSSMDFADQTLKNCVKAIHADIVELWNMDDRTGVSILCYYGLQLLTEISI